MISEIFKIAERKYEVLDKHGVLSGLLSIVSVTNTSHNNQHQVVYHIMMGAKLL